MICISDEVADFITVLIPRLTVTQEFVVDPLWSIFLLIDTMAGTVEKIFTG